MVWAKLRLAIAKGEEILFTNNEYEHISQNMKQLQEWDKFEWVKVCLQWADYYMNLGQRDKVLDYLSKAEEQFRDVDTLPWWLGRIHESHHRISLLEDDLHGAHEHLKKAIEFMKECGADGWVERYERQLAEL